MTRKLPETASVALPTADDRLFAPSAERNGAAICALLDTHAPRSGRALEIASGTGQHVVRYAVVRPELIWQPTDLDLSRLASIDAYARAAGVPNIAPARRLDAARPGWAAEYSGQDLIILANLLHLISEQEAHTVVTQAMRALAPSGKLMIYGPFLRDGRTISEADANFDASLRAQDPDIGYKDIATVQVWVAENGGNSTPHEMPANNIMLISQGPI